MNPAFPAMAVATTCASPASGRAMLPKASGSGATFAPGKAFSISFRAQLRRDIASPNWLRRLLIHSSWMPSDQIGLKAPASAIHSRKSRTPLLNRTHASRTAVSTTSEPPGSVAEILGFGGECFERSAAGRLLAPVGDHCAHRNAMMGADHATRQNASLDEI